MANVPVCAVDDPIPDHGRTEVCVAESGDLEPGKLAPGQLGFDLIRLKSDFAEQLDPVYGFSFEDKEVLQKEQELEVKDCRPDLFVDFAGDAFLQRLAQLDPPARECHVPLANAKVPLDEDAATGGIEDDGSSAGLESPSSQDFARHVTVIKHVSVAICLHCTGLPRGRPLLPHSIQDHATAGKSQHGNKDDAKR